MIAKKSGVAALAAILTSILAACGVGEANVPQDADQSAATPLPVEVLLPYRDDMFATYRTTATISSESEAPVLARAEGEVVEILVEEGDRVEAGQVLARLDGERLRLQMLQARANLEQARKEYERSVRLHKKGLVSASAYESLKFDLDALSASYELKRLNYEYTSIRAPIGGVISSREVKIGRHVDVNDVVFAIHDTDLLVSYLRIPQTELGKFSVGHLATVRVDAMPDREFVAEVARISPTIDARTGTFRATVYIDNRAGELAPGMFGRFRVAYEMHSDVLVIPFSALVQEDNETIVFVVRDGAAVRRTIETGIAADGKVEVVRGLDESEPVIVMGQAGLRDGSKVLAKNPVTGTTVGG